MSRLLWSPTGEEVTAHSEAEEREYLARGYRETAAPPAPAPPVEAVTAEADDEDDDKPKRSTKKK